MRDQLPALQVVIPLLGAVLCALLRRGTISWLIALASSWCIAVVSVLLLLQVLDTGPISYAMGAWEPPWGIEYRVDALSAFLLVLISVVGAVIMPYAHTSVCDEIEERNQGWFYTMYLLCLAGLLGIAITGDAFNAFVFLEISSLSTYAMIALGKDRRALLAAYQYLIMGTIGATMYVIGVGLLYSMTGSLNLVDIASRLGEVETSRPILAAVAFITVGVSLKLALFPLHVWLPNAYAFAPSVATAFLAATATKVAVYLLLRFLFSVFGVSIVVQGLPVTEIFLILSLAAMFGASIVAIFQEDIKRMLAYSSVAQIGYITLGIALASQTGSHGRHCASGKPRHDQSGAVPSARRGGLPDRGLQNRRHERTRQEDAGHHGRLRHRRAGHHRNAGHGGIHLQVVPRDRRLGAGLVVARHSDCDELIAGGHLYRPGRRGYLVPSARQGGREGD